MGSAKDTRTDTPPVRFKIRTVRTAPAMATTAGTPSLEVIATPTKDTRPDHAKGTRTSDQTTHALTRTLILLFLACVACHFGSYVLPNTVNCPVRECGSIKKKYDQKRVTIYEIEITTRRDEQKDAKTTQMNTKRKRMDTTHEPHKQIEHIIENPPQRKLRHTFGWERYRTAHPEKNKLEISQCDITNEIITVISTPARVPDCQLTLCNRAMSEPQELARVAAEADQDDSM
eukprot:1819674-Pyramimonas_sp.AAC.1